MVVFTGRRTGQCATWPTSGHGLGTRAVTRVRGLAQPPMEKQKWWGQHSGLADLQENIGTASCGEEQTGDCPGPVKKPQMDYMSHRGVAYRAYHPTHPPQGRLRVENMFMCNGPGVGVRMGTVRCALSSALWKQGIPVLPFP